MIKKIRSVSTVRINIWIKTIMALAMICTIAIGPAEHTRVLDR